MDTNKETAGYKFAGVVKEFDGMGETLKPVNEIEITNLTDKETVNDAIRYLESLENDVNAKKFVQGGNSEVDKELLRKRAMKNPGDFYVSIDGKKTPLAKYLKNKKSLNTQENHTFAKEGDPNFAKGNKNLDKVSPGNYNNMVFNTPKAGVK